MALQIRRAGLVKAARLHRSWRRCTCCSRLNNSLRGARIFCRIVTRRVRPKRKRLTRSPHPAARLQSHSWRRCSCSRLDNNLRSVGVFCRIVTRRGRPKRKWLTRRLHRAGGTGHIVLSDHTPCRRFVDNSSRDFAFRGRGLRHSDVTHVLRWLGSRLGLVPL
jgi:hypothetical protein